MGPASADPCLARAFLALSDDPGAPPAQRSAPRVLVAATAALVLSIAAPLAWTVADKVPDPPVAAQKAYAPSPQADDDEAE